MNYQQSINSPFMYLLGGIVAAFVIVQSLVFIRKAWREGIRMGMKKEKLWSVVKGSALFSIMPSIAILITLFSMIKALGVPIPWIRLSVVGAATYELPVATQAAKAMGLAGLEDPNFTLSIFAGVVFVMTIGIIWGLFMVIFGLKKILKGVDKIGSADKKWGEIFVTSLFMGLVSTFVGVLITPPLVGLFGGTKTLAEGLTGILVLVTSAAIMVVLKNIAAKNARTKWLDNFALPVSMIVSMALAIVYHIALGGA